MSSVQRWALLTSSGAIARVDSFRQGPKAIPVFYPDHPTFDSVFHRLYQRPFNEWIIEGDRVNVTYRLEPILFEDLQQTHLKIINELYNHRIEIYDEYGFDYGDLEHVRTAIENEMMAIVDQAELQAYSVFSQFEDRLPWPDFPEDENPDG